jgi:DHA3 family macrolide efflux protein-like MFS transporter
MQAFTLVWFGQVVSLLGSAMTWFALTLWAWQKTGQATALSTISFFTFLPAVLFTPIAGALVDRWNRKVVMMLADGAAALGTLAVLILYLSGDLQIWHLYLIGVLAGFFTAFQYPAYQAAVTTMLPERHYARAQGMLGLATALSGILAPVLAAALLGVIDMAGIMLIDLATFGGALAALLIVPIPQPAVSAAGQTGRGSLGREILFGFHYIRRHAGLRALTVLFVFANFFLAIAATLMAPLVLSGSGQSRAALAAVQSLGAVGGVVGGGLLSLWGGFRRRVHNVLWGGIGACLLGVLTLGLGRVVLVWAVGSFFFSFFEPFVEGGNMALWQARVEADVQGRVFSARHLLVQIPYLLGVLVSGPLAEYGLGVWAGGEAGIRLAVILAAAGGLAAFGLGAASRSVRRAEDLPPAPAL